MLYLNASQIGKSDIMNNNLTLTSVVFEWCNSCSWICSCYNLTLTSVVFECHYFLQGGIYCGNLTLTSVVFEFLVGL